MPAMADPEPDTSPDVPDGPGEPTRRPRSQREPQMLVSPELPPQDHADFVAKQIHDNLRFLQRQTRQLRQRQVTMEQAKINMRAQRTALKDLAKTIEAAQAEIKERRDALDADAATLAAEREELDRRSEELEHRDSLIHQQADAAELQRQAVEQQAAEFEAAALYQRQELDAQRAIIAELQTNINQQTRTIAEQNQQLATRAAEIAAAKASLEVERESLAAQRTELDKRCEMLDARKRDIEAQNAEMATEQSAIAQAKVAGARDRAELAVRDKQLEEQSAALSVELRALQQSREADAGMCRKLDERQKEIAAAAAQLAADRDASLKADDQRRNQLLARQKEMDIRSAQFVLDQTDQRTRAKDLEQQASQLAVDRAALEQARVSDVELRRELENKKSETARLAADLSSLRGEAAKAVQILHQQIEDARKRGEAEAEESKAHAAKLQSAEAHLHDLEAQMRQRLAGVRAAECQAEQRLAELGELETHLRQSDATAHKVHGQITARIAELACLRRFNATRRQRLVAVRDALRRRRQLQIESLRIIPESVTAPPPPEVVEAELITAELIEGPLPVFPPTAPLPADVASTASLVLLTTGNVSYEFPITGLISIIGRDSSCDLSIDLPTISRSHCLIVRHAGRFRVRDAGSTNGTLVNGQPIMREELAPGDVVNVGGVELTLVVDGEPVHPGAKSVPIELLDRIKGLVPAAP